MVEKIPKNIEHSRKVAEIVLDHPELKYDDLHAQTEKESEEKFNQRAREIFSKLEVVVHGMGNKAETGKEKQRGDIDGEVALGLLRKADIKFNKIEYIPKGQSQPGKIHIDTGNKNGIVIEKEKDGTATIYFDHHSPDFSLEPTSATQLIYEGLTGAGLLKEKPHLNKLVEFVTQVDNLSYPEEYYEEYPNYDRMLVGLWSHISFKHLEQFFLDDKLPTNILTPEEIRKYNLQKTSEAQKSHIERCLKLLPELEKDGFIIETDKYGKILVDIGGKLRPQGTIPAKYYSCDGYVMWMPDENGFLITVPGQDIDDDFIPGNKIRGSMWIKPKDDSSPRKITLGEILHKLSGGKLDPTGKLKEFLDTEKSKVYNENTVAETRESPEIPKSKVVDQLIDDLDASQADKLNSDLITSEAYKESLGVLDEARDLNLEDPKEALNHLLLSGLELISDDLYNQKIKELEGEQGIAQPETSPASGLNSILDNNPAHVESSPEQEPETHESVHIHTGPDGEVTETETEREVITPGTNQEAAQAIDNRIDEINKKLSEEVLPWSKAQEFKKEREALWTQKAGGPDRELAEEDKWTDEQIDRFIFNNERDSNPLNIEAEYWKGIKQKKAQRRAESAAGLESSQSPETNNDLEQIRLDLDIKAAELKKIRYMIFNAKATAKSQPGIGPEGLAYWEEEKKKKIAEIISLENRINPKSKREQNKRIKQLSELEDITENPDTQTTPTPTQTQPAQETAPQAEAAQEAAPEIQQHPEITQPIEERPAPEPLAGITFEELQGMRKEQGSDIAGETPINPPSPEPAPQPDSAEPEQTGSEIIKALRRARKNKPPEKPVESETPQPAPEAQEKRNLGKEFKDLVLGFFKKDKEKVEAPKDEKEKIKWSFVRMIMGSPDKDWDKAALKEAELYAEGNKGLIHNEDLETIKKEAEEYWEKHKIDYLTDEDKERWISGSFNARVSRNNINILSTVKWAINNLKERGFKEEFFTPERIKLIEDELKAQLLKFAGAQVARDIKGFMDMLRDNPPDPELLKRVKEATNKLTNGEYKNPNELFDTLEKGKEIEEKVGKLTDAIWARLGVNAGLSKDPSEKIKIDELRKDSENIIKLEIRKVLLDFKLKNKNFDNDEKEKLIRYILNNIVKSQNQWKKSLSNLNKYMNS